MSSESDNSRVEDPAMRRTRGDYARITIASIATAACVAALMIGAAYRSPGRSVFAMIALSACVLSLRRTLWPHKSDGRSCNALLPSRRIADANGLATIGLWGGIVLLGLTVGLWMSGDLVDRQEAAITGPLGCAGIAFAMHQRTKAVMLELREKRAEVANGP